MMAKFEIKVKRLDRFKEFPELAQEEFGDAMTVGVDTVLGEVIGGSPIDRGFFRSGLSSEVVTRSPLEVIGRVTASAPHSPIIEGVDESGNYHEFGRRPGTRFPPVEAMRSWVKRTFGLSEEKTIARLAYIISRSIVRRGIRAVRPLRTGLEKSEAFLERLLNEAAEKLGRKIEGK